MRKKNIRDIELSEAHILGTYSRFPLSVERAAGSWLYDRDGRAYLDFTSGIGVLNLGHCHPRVVKAVKEQTQRYMHVSNLFYSDVQAELARELTGHLPGYQVFFGNSGAEAVEGAIKFARRYGIQTRGKSCWKIIAMEGSFHGRTAGALSLTWGRHYRKNFGPLLRGVKFVPFGDIQTLKRELTKDVCAVFTEVIQIEGAGIRPAEKQYVQEIERLCRVFGVLLVVDEIQSGLGRTGCFFAFQHYGVQPDVILSAKALGGGLPLSAIIVGPRVQEHLGPGDHASTFGGNPVACAAGLAVVKTVKSERFLQSVRNKGQFLRELLLSLRERMPDVVGEIRGTGLVWGVDVNVPVKDVINGCLNRGVLLTRAGENTLRFLPPLTVKPVEVRKAVKVLEQCLREDFQ